MCLFTVLLLFALNIKRILSVGWQSYTLSETESFAWKLLMSAEISLFRWIVMARNPRCIAGNALLLNVSQDKKKYLCRTHQEWPGKKIWPKKRIRQVLFKFSFFSLLLFLPWTLNCFSPYRRINSGPWQLGRLFSADSVRVSNSEAILLILINNHNYVIVILMEEFMSHIWGQKSLWKRWKP